MAKKDRERIYTNRRWAINKIACTLFGNLVQFRKDKSTINVELICITRKQKITLK